MIRIQENVQLKTFNTFGIRANARHFVSLNASDDLFELQQTDLFKNEPRLILGGGSNVLLTHDFNGLVIHNNLKGIKPTHETDETITLKVASGEVWHPFVMHCVQHNWGGVENLSLIPGTMGAAPMQNIGAYGVEVQEVIDQVEGIELLNGSARVFSKSDCRFGYRESIFKQELKEKFFISSVTLTLTKKNHLLRTGYGAIQDTLREMDVTESTIQAISEAVIHIRSKKLPDPAVIGNAGSFFKNPTITQQHYTSLKSTWPGIPGYPVENQIVKVPAAWLIEQCGWKGKRVGDAGVHQHQPLVIVNHDRATGEEILSLAMKVRGSVQEKFDITLTPEVNII
ncbi:MAG: UDP-N-acetylmuramate dehydrogenase [Cyclobacteriaceae bacterium]|nr:UDP-N-acetylmuramate dehydrogenase [Cyclobacteriaceae bacterium]